MKTAFSMRCLEHDIRPNSIYYKAICTVKEELFTDKDVRISVERSNTFLLRSLTMYLVFLQKDATNRTLRMSHAKIELVVLNLH